MNGKPARTADPRISAWIVLLLGTGVTVAANVLHAQDTLWARGLSGSIPLILLFAAHTAAYADDWLVRATMLPVALFAFFISYDHMNALAMTFTEQYQVAKVYPLAVDGALLVATLTLARYRNRNQTETDIPVPAVPRPEPELSFPEFFPAPSPARRRFRLRFWKTGIQPEPETDPIPVSVPEARPEFHAVAPPTFTEPPSTGVDGPTVPDYVPASEWFAAHDAPVSPTPRPRARRSGAKDLELMAEHFGRGIPSTSDIMTVLECGGSKATRLRALWTEYLESNGERQDRLDS